MLLPPSPPNAFRVPSAPPPGSVRVLCIADSIDTSGEVWPEFCAYPPRAGESIQSELGVTKKIVEVIHTADMGGTPVVMLRLGNDTTSVTPQESLGGSDSF
jgi:hypothetical protein